MRSENMQLRSNEVAVRHGVAVLRWICASRLQLILLMCLVVFSASSSAEQPSSFDRSLCTTTHWHYGEILKRRVPRSGDPEGTVSVAEIGVVSCQGMRPYSVSLVNGAYACDTETTIGIETTRSCEVPLFARKNTVYFSVREIDGNTYTASYEFDLRAWSVRKSR